MNPEFQRNLWLEWTSARVTTAGLALGAVLTLAWLVNGRGFGVITESTALACVVAFTLAWGAHLVGESIIRELRGRTWDQQRMSALTPFAMTWGKLLGAPTVAWACGGVSGCVYLLSGELTSGKLWMLLALASAALCAHAIALTGGLLMALRGAQTGQPMVTRVALFAGLIAVVKFGPQHVENDALWFGLTLAWRPFLAISTTLFAGWAVLACLRLMNDTLQVRSLPWAMPPFIVFLAVFTGGGVLSLDEGVDVIAATLCALGLACALACAYLTAFAYMPSPLMPRRLLRQASEGRWRRFTEELPPWSVPLCCALLLSLPLTLMGDRVVGLSGDWALPARAPWALCLFAVRDLLVFYGIACRTPRTGNEATQLLYLALAYWLVPAIAHLAGAEGLASMLRPDHLSGWPAHLTLGLQVVAAGWWTTQGWQARMRGAGAGAA